MELNPEAKHNREKTINLEKACTCFRTDVNAKVVGVQIACETVCWEKLMGERIYPKEGAKI